MRSLHTLETLGGKKNSFTQKSFGFPMTHLIPNSSCCMLCTDMVLYIQQACGGWAAGRQATTAVGCGCLSKVDNDGW